MNEERYAYRVRQLLNHGLKDVSPIALRRLEAARHLALSKQKSEPQLVVAGFGNYAFRSPPHILYLKQTLSVIALLLGMWLSFYWHSIEYVTELEQVDTALLADDLPPEAFLDNNFFEWLKDDSSEE
jgi:hypothetical protein